MKTDNKEANINSDKEAQSSTPAPTLSGLDPNTLYVFDNPEKKGQARLGVEEFMPFSSSRILLSGPPGSGKRGTIFNILHRMTPPPSTIHLVHCDPHTIEYDSILDMGIDLLKYSADDLPTLENIISPDGDSDSEDEDKP
jgi:hypothetical protein